MILESNDIVISSKSFDDSLYLYKSARWKKSNEKILVNSNNLNIQKTLDDCFFVVVAVVSACDKSVKSSNDSIHMEKSYMELTN